MRRLVKAASIYRTTGLSWGAAWRRAEEPGPFCVVERGDGFLYIQPRARR